MSRKFHRRTFLARAATATAVCMHGSPTFGAMGEYPTHIRGVSQSEAAAIQQLVAEFMTKHAVPGLSLAMSSKGKLKLRVCMGYADRKRQEAVLPRHRFRIASVSKPLTSVLVMLLRQQGHLNIDTPVFGSGPLGYQDELAKLGADNQRRLASITTRHLLQHTAGGWANKSKDPMFTSDALGLDHDALIRWTLSHRSLENAPGTNYDYSNFGYCLIGRVIERTLRMKYEDAFRTYVLEPFGMKQRTMRIGGNTISETQPNEVTYYGQNEDAYHRVMDVRRMDAHGGWIATPTDLVRLANRVDGFSSPPDLLNAESLRTMTTASAANSSYALGWSVNQSNNWWHTGSFNGGSAILARTSGNHCWAMTMNTRSRIDGYSRDLDQLPWKIKGAVKAWGNHDLS